MSITIQQLISDAKQLALRLKDRESTADTLLSETHSISEKIDEIRQYQEEVDILNEVARHRPHSQLIASMQQENRNFREIQQENRDLRTELLNHQYALEHIMSKYRQHTSAKFNNPKIENIALLKFRESEVIRQQSEKIAEMAAVMRAAACYEDNEIVQIEETLTRLLTENKGLREMLQISYKFGSSNVSNNKEDKDIQTESIEEEIKP